MDLTSAFTNYGDWFVLPTIRQPFWCSPPASESMVGLLVLTCITMLVPHLWGIACFDPRRSSTPFLFPLNVSQAWWRLQIPRIFRRASWSTQQRLSQILALIQSHALRGRLSKEKKYFWLHFYAWWRPPKTVSNVATRLIFLQFESCSSRRNRTTQSCLNCHTSKRMVRSDQLFEFNFQFYSISAIGNDLLVRGAHNSAWYANLIVASNVYLTFIDRTMCLWSWWP